MLGEFLSETKLGNKAVFAVSLLNQKSERSIRPLNRPLQDDQIEDYLSIVTKPLYSRITEKS